MANSTYPVGVASRAGQRQTPLLALTGALAVLAATSSLIGLLTTGGPGRQVVQTARGATVTLYGEGLYAADTWLIGAGNRGQDLAMLLFELPVLLLVLRWYWRRSPVAPAVLIAQLVSSVPLTAGEIITKMLSFAALTLVAGGLLARMAHPGASNAARSRPASIVRGSGPA
jgi:hypothetical protein